MTIASNRPAARVVIIGGGIVGLSIAFHLAQLRSHGAASVVVVERDRVGEATTAKATGGVRQQFSSAVNIDLARASVDMFCHFGALVGEPVAFRQHGYLFVTTSREKLAAAARGVELQNDRGVPARVVSPAEIAALQPALNTGDLIGGTYCPTDGSAVPADVAAAFARQARRRGVEIREHTLVRGIETAPPGFTLETTGGRLRADIVVNAAGPWARTIGAMVGVDHPVTPHPRQAFAIRRPPWLAADAPLTVDLDSGAYVHPEVSTAVVGGTDRDRPSGERCDVDDALFNRLLTALLHRFPSIETAELLSSWVGLREMTPDDHAVVGPLAAVPGYWVAAGFSGHGFMQAPAIGRALARWILAGAPDIDLTALAPERFATVGGSAEHYVF